jgi:hypothetical protein
LIGFSAPVLILHLFYYRYNITQQSVHLTPLNSVLHVVYGTIPARLYIPIIQHPVTIMGSKISFLKSLRRDHTSYKHKPHGRAAPDMPVETNTKTVKSSSHYQPSWEPLGKATFLPKTESTNDAEVHQRPAKIRKLRAGDVVSSSSGTGSSSSQRPAEHSSHSLGSDVSDASRESQGNSLLPEKNVRCALGYDGALEIAEHSDGVDPFALQYGVADPLRRGRSLYSELRSIGELAENDDEGKTTVGEGWAADGGIMSPPLHRYRDSLVLHRERLPRTREVTVGGGTSLTRSADVGGDGENKDDDVWFDAEDGFGRQGSVDTSSENTLTDTSDHTTTSGTSRSSFTATSPATTVASDPTLPPWNPYAHDSFLVPKPLNPRAGPSVASTSSTASSTAQHVDFSPEVHRYAVGLGYVRRVPVGEMPLPSVTVTPPTPRSVVADAAAPAYRRVVDTTRLSVRESDRDVRGKTARRKRAVQHRLAIVKRRRQRMEDVLARKVGWVGALMTVYRQTKEWDEWAWSGKEAST